MQQAGACSTAERGRLRCETMAAMMVERCMVAAHREGLVLPVLLAPLDLVVAALAQTLWSTASRHRYCSGSGVIQPPQPPSKSNSTAASENTQPGTTPYLVGSRHDLFRQLGLGVVSKCKGVLVRRATRPSGAHGLDVGQAAGHPPERRTLWGT